MAAAQVAQNWTGTKLAPTVYNPSTDNSAFFTAPATVTTARIITGVSWNIALYTNGSTIQTFQICYAQPYTSTSAYNLCKNVTNELVGSNSNFFNGQSAKGDFRITANISGGGAFPATPGVNQNFSIQVNFQ